MAISPHRYQLWVWGDERLNDARRLILLRVAFAAVSSTDRHGWIEIRTTDIAEAVHRHRVTVTRHLSWLVDQGYLHRQQPVVAGRFLTSQYRLADDAFKERRAALHAHMDAVEADVRAEFAANPELARVPAEDEDDRVAPSTHRVAPGDYTDRVALGVLDRVAPGRTTNYVVVQTGGDDDTAARPGGGVPDGNREPANVQPEPAPGPAQPQAANPAAATAQPPEPRRPADVLLAYPCPGCRAPRGRSCRARFLGTFCPQRHQAATLGEQEAEERAATPRRPLMVASSA